MRDIPTAEAWIKSRIRARMGSIDARPYPAEADGPEAGVIWKLLSQDNSLRAVGGGTVMTTLRYQVCAWIDGDDMAYVADLADQIDQALDLTKGQNSDGKVYACERLYPVSFPQKTKRGRMRLVMGAVFQLSVKGS